MQNLRQVCHNQTPTPQPASGSENFNTARGGGELTIIGGKIGENSRKKTTTAAFLLRNLYFCTVNHYAKIMPSTVYNWNANGMEPDNVIFDSDFPGEPFVSQHVNIDGWATMYTFSAKEQDAKTGYHYFGARYYDSELSVWLSVDPMSDRRPGLSAYNYTKWSPLNRVDPTGMLCWEPVGNDKWKAEKGDGAESLAKDAGISRERAYRIMEEHGHGTYEDDDGVIKSDVHRGNVVQVSDGSSESRQGNETNNRSNNPAHHNSSSQTNTASKSNEPQSGERSTRDKMKIGLYSVAGPMEVSSILIAYGLKGTNSFQARNYFGYRASFLGSATMVMHTLDLRDAYNEGDALQVLSSGIMTFYSGISVAGGLPGKIVTSPFFLIDATVGMDNLLLYNHQSIIQRSEQIQSGNRSLMFWGPGRSVR